VNWVFAGIVATIAGILGLTHVVISGVIRKYYG
jgi:hypothetical protein